MTEAPAQPKNPLHGMTLEKIVTELADYYGWEGLGERINIRCFTHDPSVGSSLKFCAKHLGTRQGGELVFIHAARHAPRRTWVLTLL